MLHACSGVCVSVYTRAHASYLFIINIRSSSCLMVPIILWRWDRWRRWVWSTTMWMWTRNRGRVLFIWPQVLFHFVHTVCDVPIIRTIINTLHPTLIVLCIHTVHWGSDKQLSVVQWGNCTVIAVSTCPRRALARLYRFNLPHILFTPYMCGMYVQCSFMM